METPPSTPPTVESNFDCIQNASSPPERQQSLDYYYFPELTDQELMDRAKKRAEPSPKRSRKSLQATSQWRIDNFFESKVGCQIRPSGELPDTLHGNEKSSPILIEDDSHQQGDGQAEPNVIYISDSEELPNLDVIEITSSDDDDDDDLEIESEDTLNNTKLPVLICPNKDNERGCAVCSALDGNAPVVNSSFSLSMFVLPYSPQPYANDTNLGVTDLKDQPELTVKLIQLCLDEGTEFAHRSADIACAYLYAYRPAQRSLENLLKWLRQRDIGFALENGDLLKVPYIKLYCLLNESFHFFPENISILWEALCERMLTIDSDETAFLDFAVMLEIYLSVLEGDFFRRQEDPRKCRVYRIMANDEAYSNTKKIIQCLSKVLGILGDKHLLIAEKVLCRLQKLLELGVVVSLNNSMMAKRIAHDLISVYLNIPYLHCRVLFLSTIQSDLIRFKLLEILLEKHCGGTMLGWSYMPESIADIAKSFLQATPMKHPLHDDSSATRLHKLSPFQIEEHTMMMYFAIISYIASLQGSFYQTLSDPTDSEGFSGVQPVDNDCIAPPWNNKLSQLTDLPSYISQFNRHIRNFDVELSQGTQLYLQMLDHLTDLMDDDVTLSAF